MSTAGASLAGTPTDLVSMTVAGTLSEDGAVHWFLSELQVQAGSGVASSPRLPLELQMLT